MTKRRVVALWAFLAVGLPGLVAQQRILPLGDSITESTAGHASYRYHLWKSIDGSELCADFVGTQLGTAGGAPLVDFDQEHSGYSGWTAVTMGQAMQMCPACVPVADIALIHLGTNDIRIPLLLGLLPDLEAARTALKGIILELRVRNPNIKIAVARILPISPTSTTMPTAHLYVPIWNTVYLPQVASMSSSASPVILVDQNSGFVHPTHFDDDVHPNDLGEQKLAAQWFLALAASGWLVAGVPCVATLSPGCGNSAGSAGPSLLMQTSTTPPSPDTTLAMDVTSMPASTAIVGLVLGITESSQTFLWGGCPVHPSLDVVMLAAVTAPTVSFSLLLPATMRPGSHVYIQALTIGTTANDETTSNGLQLIVF